MEEVEQIHEFMSKVGENVQVIWGASFDEDLKENVKITLIATGFEVSDIPGMPASIAKAHAHKPVMSAEASRFFDSPKTEEEQELELTDEEDQEPTKPNLEKTYEQYYGNTTQPGTEIEPEPEPELPIFTLDDLEDETTLKKVENIPAWKRKLMKK